MNRLQATFLFLMLCAASLFGNTVTDGVAKIVMERYGERLLAGDFKVGELFGDLYIKEYVDVDKQTLALSLIPDLTRFDMKKQNYLSEFFYEIHYVNDAVPDIRRIAHLSSFRHGTGEIDRVFYYMNPDFFSEKLFKAQYLSPIYPTNYQYYRYSVDTTYSGERGECKILFEERFDNVKLLTRGWVIMDGDFSVRAFRAEGWDEQSDFAIECIMGTEGLERFVVKDILLDIDYKFAFNRLKIRAEAAYDYYILSNILNDYKNKSRYDLTGSLNTNWNSRKIQNYNAYATLHRKKPLSFSDSLIYIKKGVIAVDSLSVSATAGEEEPQSATGQVLKLLWNVGDEMISSHYLDWGDSDLKVYPLINPSYLRYSTSKGVTYKFAVNLRNKATSKNSYSIKPMVGYSFKKKGFYWGINGDYVYDPRNRGIISFSVSRENSIYREVEVQNIGDMNFSDVRFSEMAINYFRDTRISVGLQRELFNGFDVLVGNNFYIRSMHGDAVGQIVDGEKMQRKYKNFAPHLQLTWHPGMYHYYDGDRKVNLGSRKPRFSLDVEQGVRGPFESKSVYTRVELDMQYKQRLSSSATLYSRLGCGGYFYEKDAYFISYTFLKDNILPLDKNDELSGVFQLLDSEWYYSANRYFRANAAYVSPFLVLQKILPRVNIFKNEMLFFNMLFMSNLSPYTEYGYGIETPYIDFGIFAGFENVNFHRIGCKVTISLFED